MLCIARWFCTVVCCILLGGSVCAADGKPLQVSLELPSKKSVNFSVPSSWKETDVTERNVNYTYSLTVTRNNANYFVFIRAVQAFNEPVMKWAEDEADILRKKGGSKVQPPKEIRIGSYIWFLIESEKVSRDTLSPGTYAVKEYFTKTNEDMIVEVTVIVDGKNQSKVDIAELYKTLAGITVE